MSDHPLLFVHPIAQDQCDGLSVGTVVRDREADGVGRLLDLVTAAIPLFDFPAHGVGVIPLHAVARELVLSGVAPMPTNPEEVDFVPRHYRGEWVAALDRSLSEIGALRPDSVSVVVYTAEAFLGDPQATDEEKTEFTDAGYTHALVTILAAMGPEAPPFSSRRLVRNLAGGSARYRQMVEGGMSAEGLLEELEAEARATTDYEQKWVTVG